MTVTRCDVGIVSADPALVDFYATVFELTPMPTLDFPQATIYRLQCGSSVLKVMVPPEVPAPAPASERFSDTAGIRYVTLSVTDADAVLARGLTHGGAVVIEPFELRPGVRVAMLTDPEGNTVELLEGED
jgi:predicted enzyme related to lactoylglutathione lyase